MLQLVSVTVKRRLTPHAGRHVPAPPDGFTRARDWRRYRRKPRIYFRSADGETLGEDFAHRFIRPHRLYRQLLAQVLKEAGLGDGLQARWSQRGGCSCGCSPAFVLDDPRMGPRWGCTGHAPSFTPYDIFVAVSAERPLEAKADLSDPDRVRRALGNRAQIVAQL